MATVQKDWFSNTVEMFNIVEEESADELLFLEKAPKLACQILGIAICKKSIDEMKVKMLAYESWKSIKQLPPDRRITALAASPLFQFIVENKQVSELDRDYYRNILLKKQINGFAAHAVIGNWADNEQACNWICDVHATLQKPEEQHEMHLTLEGIDEEFYKGTQQQRMKIGQSIRSKQLCETIATLLATPTLTTVGVPEEVRLYNDYIASAPTHCQEILRRNLVLSLTLKARQLP